MKISYHSLSKLVLNIIKNKSLLLRGVNIIFSLMFVFYLIKEFDVHEFGRYALIITILKILPFFINFNIQEYLFKSIPNSEGKEKSKAVIEVFNPILLFSLLYTTILCVYFSFGSEQSYSSVCFLVVLLGVSRAISSFFVFNGDIVKFSLFDLLISTLWILPFIIYSIFFNTNSGVTELFTIRFLTTFIVVAIFLIDIYIKHMTPTCRLKYMLRSMVPSQKVLKYSLASLPSIVIISSIEIVDRWILTLTNSEISVGYLGYILMPANVLFGIMTTVFISPMLSKLYEESQNINENIVVKNLKLRIYHLLKLMILLSFPVYVSYYIVSYLFFFEKYQEAIPYLFLSFFIVLLNSLNYYLRFAILNFSRFKVNFIYSTGLLLSVLLNYLLSYYYDFIGSILASILVSLCILVLSLRVVKHD